MQDEPTKRKLAAIEHGKKERERQGARLALKAEYRTMSKELAFADLKAKIKSFTDYHVKIAKDGVGFTVDNQGKQVVVNFTGEQRISHMDKAAGIEEITAYIDRMLSEDKVAAETTE